MAKRKPKSKSNQKEQVHFCNVPKVKERKFSPNVFGERARLIRINGKKWANGTVLRYFIFKGPSAWATSKNEEDVVREAFAVWQNLGIGLSFVETDVAEEAEIRIGFLRFDGAWSYVGRDVLGIGSNERTMNFGWDISDELDTAIHEIGHTIGFSHEHQNSNAGIKWDEDAVVEYFSGPPNGWDEDDIEWNILRKLPPDEVQGSEWDPNSVMHYSFLPGLIHKPKKYRKHGLYPEPGLSERDVEWVLHFYPPIDERANRTLTPLESVSLKLKPGEQENFAITPDATRYYNIQKFGESDGVMVLFEDVNGELRYATADDDSAEEDNARIRVKLYRGRKYVLRVRMYYAGGNNDTGIMLW